ncbi:hypothetical protein C6A87_000670 [Mycobacterium sp. ITM-2016-00317]|uniref:hypothetical protein n=1 Tax=Mycobacterium sp. ITM-2016-00317 TaxID=2099694 RepID=UPI00287FED7F|nr:hypothetical protein [Mycobacterium sp. ITM-2016-00317]WNG87840.1 hypothetical protein C6A87_000670 [Mycobacterium sp. ITM-2016-00317]
MASSVPTTAIDKSDIASAGDDGPVDIITEDASCASWAPISETFSAQAADGWNDRDPSVPASDWTSDQRKQYEAVADAMRVAAEGAVALAKLTPHRVMRELYEQSIAYWRAYADSVSTYSPNDDHLARVATAASNAIGYICSAITYGSAASRAPFVLPTSPPLSVEAPQDPAHPSRYLTAPLSVCSAWISATEAFDSETAEWLESDPNIPSYQWSPEQRAIWQRLPLPMGASAGEMQNLGVQSLNATFGDFASLSAQYRRAFVQAIPSYVPADGYLANAAAELVAVNGHACRAVGAN